jgi:hypothetical protein
MEHARGPERPGQLPRQQVHRPYHLRRRTLSFYLFYLCRNVSVRSVHAE